MYQECGWVQSEKTPGELVGREVYGQAQTSSQPPDAKYSKEEIMSAKNAGLSKLFVEKQRRRLETLREEFQAGSAVPPNVITRM
jgi:hypothetical protein